MLASAKGAPALQWALKLMPKRSDPALDLAAIAFLPPDLASPLVHVAYLGERPGRYQGRIPLTRKLTLHGVPCPASSLA